MRTEELNDLVDEILGHAKDLLVRKNASYSGGSDALGSFKEVSKSVETSPLKAWASYYIKHHMSIMAYIRRGDESEPIEERALDVISYMVLFIALIREERRRSGKAKFVFVDDKD